MLIIDIANRFLNKLGAQLVRHPDLDLERRAQLIKHYKINKILDVGANTGVWSNQMRKLGYESKIISFEPIRSVYEELEKSSKKDPNWEVFNFALGDKTSNEMINISDYHPASSILEMLPECWENCPESKYIKTEEISVKKLDSIFDEITSTNENIFLKIDTQGYEKKVLDGAANSLRNIKGIQLEMSLVSLYKNDDLIWDMIDYLNGKDFDLFSLENGFSSPDTGRLLQVDGVFFKK
jgi:FkbM family methyltransferase